MLENGADRQGRGRLGEMIYKEQASAIDVRKSFVVLCLLASPSPANLLSASSSTSAFLISRETLHTSVASTQEDRTGQSTGSLRLSESNLHSPGLFPPPDSCGATRKPNVRQTRNFVDSTLNVQALLVGSSSSETTALRDRRLLHTLAVGFEHGFCPCPSVLRSVSLVSSNSLPLGPVNSIQTYISQLYIAACFTPRRKASPHHLTHLPITMRAFDDICVAPSFQEEEQPSTTSKTVVAAVVCGVAAFAGYSIYLGRLPDLHGLDAVRYVARLAGLRP
ncbi:hypothetical protein BC629DRAFT_444136 [Irpex lacteus]|nr:hypothetical protein BC629DRAFT_444136 [Irpex lacteus]